MTAIVGLVATGRTEATVMSVLMTVYLNMSTAAVWTDGPVKTMIHPHLTQTERQPSALFLEESHYTSRVTGVMWNTYYVIVDLSNQIVVQAVFNSF